eukprot:c19558_g2_i3.p1 GENE.c19558_g2_i3~~c19558_g2_i3.p1  ORF type:complete len:302 (+),score=63.70 c19558_g2_i3:419-1324(+)
MEIEDEMSYLTVRMRIFNLTSERAQPRGDRFQGDRDDKQNKSIQYWMKDLARVHRLVANERSRRHSPKGLPLSLPKKYLDTITNEDPESALSVVLNSVGLRLSQIRYYDRHDLASSNVSPTSRPFVSAVFVCHLQGDHAFDGHSWVSDSAALARLDNSELARQINKALRDGEQDFAPSRAPVQTSANPARSQSTQSLGLLPKITIPAMPSSHAAPQREHRTSSSARTNGSGYSSTATPTAAPSSSSSPRRQSSNKPLDSARRATTATTTTTTTGRGRGGVTQAGVSRAGGQARAGGYHHWD